MRVNRNRSRPLFRQQSRWRGCLPLIMIMSLCAVIGFFGRGWISDWVQRVLNPPPPTVGVAAVRTAFANGELDRAVQYGRQIMSANPDNIPALTLLVRALIYRSYVDYNRAPDRQQALDISQRAADRLPESTAIQGIYAYALQANGRAEDAAEVALAVIERDDDNIAARLALALSYGSRGIFAAAERNATRAVELADANAPLWRADAHRALAITHSDLGDYDKAAAAAEKAIDYQRRLIPLHFERALYAMQVGDMDTATAYYFNVIAFDSENVKARLRLCEVSSTLRERDVAVEYCSEVTDRAPGWVDGWYYLGREYFLQGNFNGAKDAFGRCRMLQVAQSVPMDERRYECWYLQGQAAEVVGDCDTLQQAYAEFQAMKAQVRIEETWSYPPGGPPGCAPLVTEAVNER